MRHQTTISAILLLLALGAHHIGAQSSDCLSDDQCDSNLACREFQCVDPCQINSPCVANSECKVNDHAIECLCQPGFIGDAYTECITANRCTTNEDCDSDKTCASDNCVDPCTAVISCGDNTNCSVVDHSISCVCLPGYSGNAYDTCTLIGESENAGNTEGTGGNVDKPETSEGNTPTIAENNPGDGENVQGNKENIPSIVENTPVSGAGENTAGTEENSPGAGEYNPETGGNTPDGDKIIGNTHGAGEHKPEVGGNAHGAGGHTGVTHPDSVAPAHKKYYAETSVMTDWHGALKMCQEKGKQLATVTSRHDNDQILQTIARTKIRKGHFWTAGTDKHKEGHWVWETTGQPFDFTFWHFLQPDNLFVVGGEDCMGYKEIGVHIASGYKWNDKKCDHHAYAICEEIDNTKYKGV